MIGSIGDKEKFPFVGMLFHHRISIDGLQVRIRGKLKSVGIIELLFHVEVISFT